MTYNKMMLILEALSILEKRIEKNKRNAGLFLDKLKEANPGDIGLIRECEQHYQFEIDRLKLLMDAKKEVLSR